MAEEVACMQIPCSRRAWDKLFLDQCEMLSCPALIELFPIWRGATICQLVTQKKTSTKPWKSSSVMSNLFLQKQKDLHSNSGFPWGDFTAT